MTAEGRGARIERRPIGDDAEFVGAALETETLLPNVVEDDFGGAG